MNKIRFIALITGFAALLTSAIAQSTETYTLAAGINRLVRGPVNVKSITIQDTSGAANTITFYDNDSTSSTNVITPSYVSVTEYSTNVIQSWTTPLGTTQYATNTFLAQVAVTNAATTNEAPRIFRYVIPANGTVTYTPRGQGWGFSRAYQVLATGAANLISFQAVKP
jgi:hypothetical protein